MKQLYFLPLLFFSFLLQAQTPELLKAKVLDEYDNPIEGVNISNTSTKKGTVSNDTGYFEIEVLDLEQTILLFSHVAFKNISLPAQKISKTKVVILQDAYGQLEDVIIAQKKVDNPAEVITMVSKNFIEQNEIIGLEQAADYVPGLEIYAQTANLPNYAIRGITDETVTPSANSRVSVFVDGIAKTKPTASLRSIFDMKTIEVTKGPQIAKYGKVTQAGGINLIQNQAQNDTSGKLGIGFGNFDEKYINGYFNTPLVKDKLFFRVSGMHQFRKGYVENTGQGADFNSTNTFALRTAFKYLFSDKTTLDVIANYQEDSPSTVGVKSTIIPQRDGNTDRFTGVELERGDDLGLERNVRNISALFNHHWDKWSLHGNVGYEKYIANEYIEVDGSPATAAVIQDLSVGEMMSTGWSLDYKSDKISTKFGFNTQLDDATQTLTLDLDEQNAFIALTDPKNATFNGQPVRVTQFSPLQFAGLLFQLEQGGFITLEQREQLMPLASIPAVTQLQPSVIESSTNGSKNISSDVYGSFGYNVTDKFNIDLALRLTHDYIEGSLFAPLNASVVTLPTGQVLGRPIGLLTGAYPNNITNPFVSKSRIHKNFLSVTGSVALDYEVSTDLNVFASVARGRRPQSINYFNNDFRITEDEKVWNYEAGFKSFLFENKLSLNSSIYLLKFTNFSTPVSDSEEGQTGQLNFNIDDTGKATSFGVEFDFNYFLNNETTVFGNYNFVDATIDDKDVNGNRSQYAGNRIRLTPKHAFTTGFNWQKEITEEWDFFVRPNFTFKSDIYFTAANVRNLRQHSYGLLNFRTGVHFKKKYELNFFMRNVTDRRYINDAGNSGNQFGIPTTIAGPSRMFGWRLIASF